MNQYVYILWHTREIDEDTEDSKLLGVYSSWKKAQGKIEEYKLLPGFCEYPDGFLIDRCVLNKDEWTEGFITLYT